MSNPSDQTLLRVMGQVFEKLAFMLSMPSVESDRADFSSGTTARVSFTGPCSGQLILLVSDHLLPRLVANMLGVEDESEPEDARRHDAVKELLNILCGNLLPEIAGADAEFRVGIPEMLAGEVQDEIAGKGEPFGTARMLVDEGWAQAFLFIEGDPAARSGPEELAEAGRSE